MIRTIISHDPVTGGARIRFEHAGVTVEDNFVLIDVVPGTKFVFQQMGLVFDEAYQDMAIERLTTSIESQIDGGAITNPPVTETPAYTPSPESEAESVETEPDEEVAE